MPLKVLFFYTEVLHLYAQHFYLHTYFDANLVYCLVSNCIFIIAILQILLLSAVRVCFLRFMALGSGPMPFSVIYNHFLLTVNYYYILQNTRQGLRTFLDIH